MSARRVALAVFAMTGVAEGHPLAFGSLDARELGDGSTAIVWRFSGTERDARGMVPVLSARCERVGEALHEALEDGGEAQSWRVRCAQGLAGESLTLRGLDHAGVQVVARYVGRDGSVHTALLDDAHRVWRVPSSARRERGLSRAFTLGVTHVALGWDHLLFVLGALLLAREGERPWRRVALTVTAFTAGHSVTLAMAALDVLRPSPAWVEACIAWSLVVLARELLVSGEVPSWTRRHPQLATCAFGLLHGFGFASALASTGLDRGDVVRTLLGFNAGVEVAQMAFVLLCAAALRALPYAVVRRVPWAIGAAGAYALIERTGAMLGR